MTNPTDGSAAANARATEELIGRLGGTMDAPPNPTADTFAREVELGGELEADLPIVSVAEADAANEPELPTHVTRTGSGSA